jgi:hypothetical protein
MWSPTVDRMELEREVGAARVRALALVPFSPAWDAAMTLVEDLERELWRFDCGSLGDDRGDRRRDIPVAGLA